MFIYIHTSELFNNRMFLQGTNCTIQLLQFLTSKASSSVVYSVRLNSAMLDAEVLFSQQIISIGRL